MKTALKESFIQAQNSLRMKSENLIDLETILVADKDVVAALYGAKSKGTDLFHDVIDSPVLAGISLYYPIKRSNVKMFCFKNRKSLRVTPNIHPKTDGKLRWVAQRIWSYYSFSNC